MLHSVLHFANYYVKILKIKMRKDHSTGFCAFSINIKADNGNRTRLSSLGS